MSYLKDYAKDKLPVFIASTTFLVVGLILYPICLESVYNYYNDLANVTLTRFRSSFKFVIMFFPAMYLFWVPRFFRYIGVLLDIIKQKQVTVIVKGLNKPDAEAFDRRKEIYFIWKTKDAKNKKYKFIVYGDVNTLKGKTKKHFYKVTYYKYSKIVTGIEKLDKTA